MRDRFACTLPQWPASIKHLELCYRGDAPLNENSPPVARSQEGEDSLSIALNRFTQRLTTIKINNIMICPEFFWPSDKFNPRSTVWNSLTSLELQYAVATPAGEWLFEREPRDKDDEDDEDDQHDIYSDRDACIDLYGLSPYPRGPAMEDFPERRFRSMPTPNLNEFYLAAGRAAQQMPELKVMALEANVIISSSDRAVYWFRYCRALQKASWVGTSRFRMDEKVKEAWREASRKHGLDELKIENVGFVEYDVYPVNYDDVISNEDQKQMFGFRLWDD